MQKLKKNMQWVCWSRSPQNGKIPKNPLTGGNAQSNNPATWGSYELAENASSKYDGIGFMFADGICGIDIDGISGDLKRMAQAQDIIHLMDTYTEYSPSGTGYHLIFRCDITRLPKEYKVAYYQKNPKNGLECYFSGLTNRFFTYTGRAVNSRDIEHRTEQILLFLERYMKKTDLSKGKSVTGDGFEMVKLSVNEILQKAAAAKNGMLFNRLWAGDTTGFSSQSEADISLCNILAFWTGRNPVLMDELFRQSGLMRDKWERQQAGTTYGAITIKKACADCREVYTEPIRATAQEDFANVRYDSKKCEVKPTANGYAPVEVVTVKGKLKIKRASEIVAKEMKYLIHPYFPAGTFTIVAGMPGSSKTWFSLYLAALISNGGEFITDNPFEESRKPETVIYQSKENDESTVIRPRLDTLKANLDNIIIIDDCDEDNNGTPLTLTDGRLEEAIKLFNPALVILDPLQSYLGDGVDMYRPNEVRPVLDKIMDLGSKYECAFVIIMHLSKMTTVPALDRILGSIDFRAAARSIVIIGSDPENRERRIMAHAKFNNGRYGQSIVYRIDDEKGVVIEGFCDFNEDQIVQGKKSESRGKPSTSLDEAKEFLKEFLKDSGYAKKNDIEKSAKEIGIKERTLYNAKKELDIRHMTLGFYPKITWWYFVGSPPPKEKQPEQMYIEESTQDTP